MGGKAGGTTIGYRYKMGLHMGLSRGPIDEIVEIRVGDLRAWPQFDTDYKTVNVFEAVADMVVAAIADQPSDVSWVTDDADPSKNGYYRREGSTWNYIGATQTSVAITESGVNQIDAPNLFGGDDKEGGINGPLTVMMGEDTQTCPTSLSSLLTGIVPGFRGVATAFFNGLVCSMNPYPKSWAFRLRRAVKGWYNDTPWYPEKAIITLMGFEGDGGDSTTTNDDYTNPVIKAMNPAHMILECATNPEWGKGIPMELLNLNSFRQAADTLFDEGFGLCMMWMRTEDVDVFVQSIINHIGAAVYVDRASGLLTLRLIRNDYIPGELVVWTTDNGLISIDQDTSSTQDTSYNEVIVTFTEAVTGKQASVRWQSIASFQSIGQIQSTTANYPGIPTKALAARVAARDGQVQCMGLTNYVVKLNRKAWKIAPGSVFAVADPKRDIGFVVLRAGNISDGTDTDGTITINAAQDVFGLPDNWYIEPQTSQWTPPVRLPVAPTQHRLMEAPYRDLVRSLTPADFAAVTDDESFVASVVASPGGTTVNYLLFTEAAGEATFVQRGSGDFSPTALLNGAIGPYDTSAIIDNMLGFDSAILGTAMLVDNEIIRVDVLNSMTGELTIARGCADTIPAAHADNARVWFYEDEFVEDDRAYTVSEVISAKYITVGTAGRLDQADSPTDSVTIGLRQACPYPPANVLANDGTTDFPVYSLTSSDVFSGDFTIKWVGRDRITQADQLIEFSAANVGPETGVSYTIRVYDDDGVTLLRTDTAITSPYSYDSVKQAADGDPEHPIFELVSVRDGLESFYKNRFKVFRVALSGYGNDYGKTWGKVL